MAAASRAMRPELPAMLLASAPACPCSNWLAVAVSLVVPSAVWIIGMFCCPASPALPKFTLAGVCARAIARLFCAILNSLRKPFSTMLTSFKLSDVQARADWLPT